MTKDAAVIRSWIEACRRSRCPLTKWEEEFIDSVAEQLEERGSVSDRQEEIIERIYADKT